MSDLFGTGVDVDPHQYINQALNSVDNMVSQNIDQQLQESANDPINTYADYNLSREPLNNPGAMSQWSPGDSLMNAGRPAPGHQATPLNAVFRSGLQKLVADFGGKVKVSSGSRSDAEQTSLWNAALKKYGSPEEARKWVAPPGTSNHNLGLAADLSFADNSTLQAVHARAKQYGLQFPLGNENWHVEPLGSRR